MAAKKAKKATPKKRGRKQHRLVIDGDWEAALSKALLKVPSPAAKRKTGGR